MAIWHAYSLNRRYWINPVAHCIYNVNVLLGYMWRCVMASSSKFDAAGARLDKALKALDGAIVKGKQASDTQNSLETQIEDLIGDRDRLLQELDVERARANKLGEVRGQVSGRIDAVMDNIRLLLSDV